MAEMSRLSGKVAIVAGGASGIGEATSRVFAEAGALAVIIADINAEAGSSIAADLDKLDGEVLFEPLDVADEGQWEALVARVTARFGRLDILVNCAGVGGPLVRPKVEDTEVAAWNKTFDVNATGAFLGMKYAIPAMRRSGGGSIVNVVSIYGLVGPAFATSYAASKGACRSLTRTAAVQYAGESIRVNAVFPGYVDTPMTKDIHAKPETRKSRLGETPLGRFGRPREIAMGIVYLASDEASFVTGAELAIDGGMTAK